MNKRGFIDFEMVVVMLLVVMFGAAIVSVFRIWSMGDTREVNPNVWLGSCRTCLEQMNADIRYAKKLSISPEALDLEYFQGGTVSYLIASGTLLRKDSAGNQRRLLENLQSGLFTPHSKLSGFVTVLFLPNDKMAIPFFTSFSLRNSSQ